MAEAVTQLATVSYYTILCLAFVPIRRNRIQSPREESPSHPPPLSYPYRQESSQQPGNVSPYPQKKEHLPSPT
ncbi:hypothetical protein KNP414_05341 [Paenibacillus mucilaginosus KNP414]|uniref:Uncharacterized protein n=1 Tax=Paenibacillus mucilaginosus (strain KNP414) TaxID=1036673 RepID=F8FG45_PAEMK|nr:hypothetical protein KNP414_05341 [Paenibacillus mucilaginosus KNP414]